MKRFIFAGAATLFLLVLPDPAQAKHKHYGSVGFQFGFYRSPPAGYGAAPGYGYYSYAPAPSFSLAPVTPFSYAPAAPMMAPSGGCFGSSYSYGYAPGTSYSPGYSYSPAYSFSPGYGYSSSSPQAGLLFPGGGILDVLRMVREFKQVIDELRPGGDGDPATKDEIQKLRSEVEALRKEVKAIEVPRGLDKQIEELKNSIDKQRDDFEAVRKYLKSKDPKTP